MKKLNWTNILFHTLLHGSFLVLTPIYFIYGSWDVMAIIAGVILYILGGLSVTFGFHRLFSHKAFIAHKGLEIAVLILSSISVMGSALRWSHGHRIHHAKTDTEDDPYNIQKGFFYAHMAWMWTEKPEISKGIVSDLFAKPWMVYQHKHHILISGVVNLIVYGLCLLVTDWLSALYICTVLRVLFIHHSTYFINSLAHTWGSRSYARELSAVDNFILALVSFGEGYHNYHHAFPNDYRNGIRWYHFDPTKWLINALRSVGLVSNLKSNNSALIKKNLVRKDVHIFLEEVREKISDIRIKEVLASRLEQLGDEIQNKYQQLSEKMAEYQAMKNDPTRQSDLLLVKIEIKKLQKEFAIGWKSWVELIRHLEKQHKILPHHVH